MFISLYGKICVSQPLFKDSNNLVANFSRPDASSQVCCSQFQAAVILCIQDLSHGVLDELRLLLETEGVAQKQSSAEDGANGIGNPVSCDVGGGAVDRLIEAGGGLEGG